MATAEGEVQLIDGCDEAIWDQLQVGEILDVGVSLSIPEIVKSLDSVGRVSALIPIFGTLAGFEKDDGSPLIDPDEIATVTDRLPVFEQSARAMDEAGLPVLASLVGDNRFKFFLRLKRADLQVESLQELDGDARIVGSVQLKVPRGKPTEVGQLLPGPPTQNRTQRRAGKVKDQNKVTLRYPSATITPIAIFR